MKTVKLDEYPAWLTVPLVNRSSSVVDPLARYYPSLQVTYVPGISLAPTNLNSGNSK